ncbi:triose-phosphate isomerase [Helicobacter mustelae]|uniref:Triosephosphate isomerase n=1 Tax=Helicobacter mustelae (strain ATCC 43772 / CCUG 25715 / CIP 103759 / LMG 18044 / NCTC 12198 / R85-136P) TaxID=679897 RepID=D3UJB5_HELM1|nr:triose-phosphate isomerase [Helicobacter mustelae]CBG40590.1 putative triosephosphate isomerase [Helicobacter mustelae 12198]SQH72087.1 triosephosphate isomerase [Helicobacter mustelae]STP13231.1 triosephosphate isomerase [Helicobacter mustelae]
MGKIIAGNFKSNLTKSKIAEYYKKLNASLDAKDSVYVFAPFFGLEGVEEQRFFIGAQNAYPAKNGAFTGEITLEALQDLKIHHLLIGHSERRNILQESQEFCAQKFEFFRAQGFHIFYCIGESLEVRQAGEDAIRHFLKSQFEGIDVNYEGLTIAYEPIWAIGTGVSADARQIQSTHEFIKKLCPRPLLYGGSVRAENITQILQIPNVDGVLIGGASLDVGIFLEMIKSARNIKG